MGKILSLKEWLRTQKRSDIAKRCGVTPRTVWQWSKHESCPLPENLKLLVEMSEGKLSYKKIVEDYLFQKHGK